MVEYFVIGGYILKVIVVLIHLLGDESGREVGKHDDFGTNLMQLLHHLQKMVILYHNPPRIAHNYDSWHKISHFRIKMISQ